MADLLFVLLLGVVEGITEFLPVSSTAHLALIEHAFGIQLDNDAFWKLFTIVIQLGAIIAVLVYFRTRILTLLRGQHAATSATTSSPASLPNAQLLAAGAPNEPNDASGATSATAGSPTLPGNAKLLAAGAPNEPNDASGATSATTSSPTSPGNAKLLAAGANEPNDAPAIPSATAGSPTLPGNARLLTAGAAGANEPNADPASEASSSSFILHPSSFPQVLHPSSFILSSDPSSFASSPNTPTAPEASPSSFPSRSHWALWAIVIGSLPLVLAAIGDKVSEKFLGSPLVIAATLIIGGILMIIIEYFPRSATTDSIEKMSWKQAFGIGLAQVLAAIFPGTSRSAATIMGGLVGGLSRSVAAEFSFFLAIPAMFAATGYSLLKFFLKEDAPIDLRQILLLIIGTLVSFLVAWVVIAAFMTFIRKHNFVSFGFYRILLGLAVLLLRW